FQEPPGLTPGAGECSHEPGSDAEQRTSSRELSDADIPDNQPPEPPAALLSTAPRSPTPVPTQPSSVYVYPTARERRAAAEAAHRQPAAHRRATSPAPTPATGKPISAASERGSPVAPSDGGLPPEPEADPASASWLADMPPSEQEAT